MIGGVLGDMGSSRFRTSSTPRPRQQNRTVREAAPSAIRNMGPPTRTTSGNLYTSWPEFYTNGVPADKRYPSEVRVYWEPRPARSQVPHAFTR